MTTGGNGDPMGRLLDAWAEHELRRLHRSSSLAFAGDYYQWCCDPNLLKLGNCDPWRPVDPDPASNDTVRSTSPAPHTLLDEFGYFFRNQPLQLQAMIVVSHFSGYQMLTDLRILTKESDWTTWIAYLDGLSPAPRELTKTIAASWLALSLAWRRHRRRIAPDNAS